MNSLAKIAYFPLWKAFARQHPDIAISERGYVADLRDNLLPLVEQKDFMEDFNAGDGKELQRGGGSSLPKFYAIHSSAALVVNCFAPFRRRIGDLDLPFGGPPESLRFEQKCPTGLRGGRPANLDVLVEGPDGIIAIESKLTEHLSSQSAGFSPAYEEQIRDERREQGYFKEMLRLMAEPESYIWLNAAQLIKHAFGLAREFKDRQVMLLYLYWEPIDPDGAELFEQHRQEILKFEERTAGSTPVFQAMSYPELWRLWSESEEVPEWLSGHIDRLAARYLVRIQ